MGRIVDTLVAPQCDRLIAVIVKRGALSNEAVVPFDDIQTVGLDALIARSATAALDRRGWRERHLESIRTSALRNMRVISDAGRVLGHLSDVLVDERNGCVEAYEIEERHFARLIGRRATLPRRDAVTIGRDVMIVSDAAARALNREKRSA